jgi:glycosyltransferase involved in cell wall biosynthesis
VIDQEKCKILTDSEHSKYSLLYFFPYLKPERISVFYPPFEFLKYDFQNKDTKKDYYLLISSNRFEKNAYRAVKAFDDLFAKKLIESKKVIVTGCPDPSIFGRIKNKGKFEFFPYVPEERLEEFFYSAFAFVFPSLNEGFGYPPLTAMKYGVPVIASSSSSIIEVCGDAALYFDPRSIIDISNRILQINYNEKLYTNLISKGEKKIQEFKSYQDTNFERIVKELFELGGNYDYNP